MTTPRHRRDSESSPTAPGPGNASASDEPKSASSKLFDLRWLIAAMFVVYGVVLAVTGIFDSKAEIAKAAGVRINLWTGIGMFVVGLVFAVWARLRPLQKQDLEADDD